MAAVRRPSACLFCQARQTSIGRRKTTSTCRQRLDVITTRPDDNDFMLHSSQPRREDSLVQPRLKPASRAVARAISIKDSSREKAASEAAAQEAVTHALREINSLRSDRDNRVRLLRKLGNPWPECSEHEKALNGHRNPKTPPASPPEAAAAPVPHSTFRRILRDAEGHKVVRQILRAQLLRCEVPRDVLRVLAVAMQNTTTAKNLGALVEPIIRSMYRCRNNVSDPEVLRTIKTIAARFDMAGLDYDALILHVGLKFAARARSVRGMKWFLRRIRQRGRGMSSHIFRSVIAKCSIGNRGLGEIRNGRWRRSDLLQVLCGFNDCHHLPPSEQFHLGAFMERSDWQYLHGWVAVLARCRDAESVWREWELWRVSPGRLEPKGLNGMDPRMTTRLRGDHWFVEQMTYTLDLKKAWSIFEEAGLPFKALKFRVKAVLLDGIEFATRWDEEIRSAMVWKYDLELSKIEKALGVTWNSEAFAHTLIPGQSQEEALERLGADDFGVENGYGFPDDGGDDAHADGAPIVESRDRALHDAEEQSDTHERIPIWLRGARINEPPWVDGR